MTDTELLPHDGEPNPYRLDGPIRPVRYELTLEPDLGAATFAGEVLISVLVTAPTDTIACNALDLDILAAELTEGPLSDGTPLAVTGVSLDAETERVTFTLERTLLPGEAHLRVRFNGQLNDKLRGFYRSTFTDTDGVEQVIATTQFEATDARRAFPCWDEPDHKASFAISLIVDEDLFAVSNASERSREPAPDRVGKHLVRFAETIVMSTYLVAFLVSDFNYTQDVNNPSKKSIHDFNSVF